jgi:hypothetical protein
VYFKLVMVLVISIVDVYDVVGRLKAVGTLLILNGRGESESSL